MGVYCPIQQPYKTGQLNPIGGKSMATTLSLRLRKLRKERGFTQAQLAKRANVRQATISEWESGTVHRMDTDLLDRVCEVLGVPLGELVLSRKSRAAITVKTPALVACRTLAR